MSRTRPLHVRPLTDAERQVLQDSLRSADAFVLRRAQIVLASAAGERSSQIAPRVGFTAQGIRDVIHAFNARGLDVLRPGSHHPGAVVSAFDTPHALALRDLLHQSPRHFGQDTSRWTLELAADVAYAQGLTPTRVSGVTIRNTLARMGVRWRRAKEWLTSPAPEDARKKARRDRLIRLAMCTQAVGEAGPLDILDPERGGAARDVEGVEGLRLSGARGDAKAGVGAFGQPLSRVDDAARGGQLSAWDSVAATKRPFSPV